MHRECDLVYSTADGEGSDGPEQPRQHVFHERGAAVCEQHTSTDAVFCGQHAPTGAEPRQPARYEGQHRQGLRRSCARHLEGQVAHHRSAPTSGEHHSLFSLCSPLSLGQTRCKE